MRDLFGEEKCDDIEGIQRSRWTWMICRQVLSAYGIGKERAGSLIANWLNSCGKDHLKLRETMEEAATKPRGDIVSYVNATFRETKKVNGAAAIDAIERRAKLLKSGMGTLR